MRHSVSASLLVVELFLICFPRTSSAIGPTIPLSPFPHPIVVTTDTLYQAWPGTDSLVLEIPFLLWTQTPTPVISNVIDLVSVEFNTDAGGFNNKAVLAIVHFDRERLSEPVECKLAYLDKDRRVVAEARSHADPEDFRPIRHLRLAPLLGGVVSVPSDHSRMVRWENSGQHFTARVPTNWATCRIEIRSATSGR